MKPAHAPPLLGCPSHRRNHPRHRRSLRVGAGDGHTGLPTWTPPDRPAAHGPGRRVFGRVFASLFGWGLPAGLLLVAGPAGAQDPGQMLGVPPDPGGVGFLYGVGDLWRGWDAFLDGWRLLDMVVVFLLAAGLGAIIAYHPRTRAKATTLAELEQPKTFIMYALVGAVTAKIVEANSAMALVVFGIGGLMRFRTDVGPAKDTGRVILTAVVGVCCGLKLLVVAVLATAIGWILLWLLERETFIRLLVKGLPHDVVGPAAEAYRRVLLASGARVLGERKKLLEGQVSFVFATPETFAREWLEQQFVAGVPDSLRGALDWDIS